MLGPWDGSVVSIMRLDSMPERLPLRRRLTFGAITVALVMLFSGLGLLGADLYLHHRYDRVSTVNVWGYRGPLIGGKPSGAVRVVVLGGSTAFGYGVSWDEAFSYYLEQRLNERAPGRFSVVNLGFNNESAASFLPTLQDFEFLNYDLAVLYEGYNDLLERARYDVYRRQSMVFTATGYMPILPMVLQEKLFAWRYAGDVGRGYQRDGADERTVFRSSHDRQAGGGLALERQLGALTPDAGAAAATDGCAPDWTQYCTAVLQAVRYARSQGARVIVATQPYIADRHINQQEALSRAITGEFAADPGVVRANLGRTIDLRNPEQAFDGIHLTATGNRIVAAALVAPILTLAGQLATGEHE